MYQNLFYGLVPKYVLYQFGLKWNVFVKIKKPKQHFKVAQVRLLYPTNVDNKKNKFSKKHLFKCVTRPDLSGVPLNYYKLTISV